jgi:hypothetical protein
MTKVIILAVATQLLFTTCLSAEQENYSYKPESGYVPDAATAISVAEAVLTPIYGKQTVDEEKPFSAELKDGVWTVEGTLQCSEGQTCKGGVAAIDISKDAGTVLRVSHGQ